MRNKYFTLTMAALMIMALGFTGCSDDDDNNPIANNQPTLNIVETAAQAGSFSTLLAAAEAAGLVGTLTSEGPLTVFAPTDSAFGLLPAGTVEALLADTASLAAILKYHVVQGSVTAAQVVTLDSAQTVNGAYVTINVLGGGQVAIDNAIVTTPDVATTNGIIHIIDKVLIP